MISKSVGTATFILVLIVASVSIVYAVVYQQQSQSITQTIINCLYFYVTNNTSDVDASVDKGAHSYFPNEQVGPDSFYDTLTEENTGGDRTLDLGVNAYDATYDFWTKVGASPYLDAQDQPVNYSCEFHGTHKP